MQCTLINRNKAKTTKIEQTLATKNEIQYNMHTIEEHKNIGHRLIQNTRELP